ncbi:GntR family transcriptional regulator [Pandoraea terrigena]|uniref:HTH-type transcriptional regulator LutR n=1 Tax=Pandoraea terrigena TaxID=2508292 RepID=A0A5E4UE24_9BURK|nr:GntR family transcriptional regulator [Pandoraea terrigena]VVD97742.1 HTH-type transcriptional regulator LutR [Pandoraea terrigena]
MSSTPFTLSSADVYLAIKTALAERQYAAGQYLRETQLAARLGVSRTPVREALRRLDAEGWVEAVPNYGVRVRAWTEQDAREIFEARLLIEPYLAGRAAQRATDDEVAQLRELAVTMFDIAREPPTAALTERWFALNDAFHAIISGGAGNGRLDRSLKSMKETPLVKWTFDTYNPEHRERSARQHLEIVDAFEQRNGVWAEAIVRCHIAAAQSVVLGRAHRTRTDDAVASALAGD